MILGSRQFLRQRHNLTYVNIIYTKYGNIIYIQAGFEPAWVVGVLRRTIKTAASSVSH